MAKRTRKSKQLRKRITLLESRLTLVNSNMLKLADLNKALQMQLHPTSS